MLERAQELSMETTGEDLAMRVLLWQDIVEAHARSPATPNALSGLEPWLRSYKYATMHPTSWSDAELDWVAPLPWAWQLLNTGDWCLDGAGGWCRTTQRFCETVLPTLRAEFPSQLPSSHFTEEGFEFVDRLYRTRNMGGLLVPLHDVMNHDLATHNVQFSDGLSGDAAAASDSYIARLARPDRRYVARAARLVSAGEALRDTYFAVDDNVHFVAAYDFSLSRPDTFQAVDVQPAELAALATPLTEDLLCPADNDECVLVEQEEWLRRRTDAMRMVPERAMQAAAKPQIGEAAEVHASALLGGADSLYDLATPGLLMLLEVCVSSDPALAVQQLRKRGWQPKLQLRNDPAAAALLVRWARGRRADTARWLETSAEAPPASLPAHRVHDARRLAHEALQTLDRALALLEEAEEAQRVPRRWRRPAFAPAREP